MKKLSILIPAYNEEQTITSILEVLKDLNLEYPLEKELIIVNDFSTDGTKELIENFIISYPEVAIMLHNQEYNQGKGAVPSPC